MSRRLHGQAGYDQICNNAERICAMHAKIHELARWNKAEGRALHAAACAEFHAAYDALAFPGGLKEGLERLRVGDPALIDTALTFLELRPYFFRSQYIRSRILRFVKRAKLHAEQKQRLDAVFAAQVHWEEIKRQRRHHDA